MKRKNKGKGINSSTSQSHPNQPQCTVPVKPLAPYGFKRTPEIDRQLPVLLEYIQSVTKPEFIPKEIASASTILYAIQEGLVSRNGDVFEIESSLTLASLTDSGAKSQPVTYPKYTVNGKTFGTDYDQANMYWQANGGTLMEKLDSMTPWHVLQSKPQTL